MRLLSVILLCSVSLTLFSLELQPLKASKEVGSFILKMRFKDNFNLKKLPAMDFAVKDGTFTRKGRLVPLNPVTGSREIDFEASLGTVRKLTSGCRMVISGVPAGGGVYEVQPVVFHKNDLSRGLDFETPERSGVWTANLGAKVSRSGKYPSGGKGCLRAEWGVHQMVSLFPGERDWTRYAELRFKVRYPEVGTRNRSMFLFDGKAVHRPGINDTIPSGRLDVFQEDRRTFRLDLRTLKKYNPRIDLSNIMAVQFFWSFTPVVGETVFYFDDVQLLTDEDLEKEKKDGRRRQLAELRNMIPDSKIKQWEGEIRVLEQWLDAGKYETLDQGVTALKEKIVNSLVLGNEDLRIVAVNSSEKVMRDTIFPYRNFPVQISAAGNERESFQAVLALSRPLKQVRFTAGELRSEGGKVIPAGNVRINPVGYVEVTEATFYPSSRTGFWPDILHRNRPFDLPERVQPFMVTVAVPAGQPAGIYTGKLTLTVDGMESRTVEYRVKVYSFSLPRKGKAKTFISFNYAPDDPALRRRVYDLVFDYRLNPVSMYPKLFKKNVNTRFLPFPEDLDYCLRKGMNFMAFGFMEDRQAKDSQCFDEEYIQAVLKWIGRWRPFLKEKGAWDIAYMIGFDEIMHRSAAVRGRHLKEAEKICRRIKQAYPDCRIANVGKLMAISPGLMDKWYNIPMDNRKFGHLLRHGKEIGFYWAYENPSFMLDLPGIAPRMCSWMAFRENADGIGYYSSIRLHNTFTEKNRLMPEKSRLAHNNEKGYGICNENCCPDPVPVSLDWDRTQYKVAYLRYARNGDGLLFHPAPDHTLLASFRLVSIRDGIEDFEYFKLLEELSGGRHPLLKIPASLVTLESYTKNSEAVQAYRGKVAAAIEELYRKRGGTLPSDVKK